jgi:hypothetical protein
MRRRESGPKLGACLRPMSARYCSSLSLYRPGWVCQRPVPSLQAGLPVPLAAFHLHTAPPATACHGTPTPAGRRRERPPAAALHCLLRALDVRHNLLPCQAGGEVDAPSVLGAQAVEQAAEHGSLEVRKGDPHPGPFLCGGAALRCCRRRAAAGDGFPRSCRPLQVDQHGHAVVVISRLCTAGSGMSASVVACGGKGRAGLAMHGIMRPSAASKYNIDVTSRAGAAALPAHPTHKGTSRRGDA